MRLYLLEWTEEGRSSQRPRHDSSVGFVVRAESREKARMIASKGRGDEGSDFWLNPKLSSCETLAYILNDATDEAGIVLRSFNAG